MPALATVLAMVHAHRPKGFAETSMRQPPHTRPGSLLTELGQKACDAMSTPVSASTERPLHLPGPWHHLPPGLPAGPGSEAHGSWGPV